MNAGKYVLTIGLVATAVASQGCVGRLIGEGAETALGAQGKYWEEKAVAFDKESDALAEYTSFELGDFTNEYGRRVPVAFMNAFPGAFARRLAESELPKDPSGKALIFNVSVIHYEEADTADNIFGPLEQVVARVELVDKASGEVIAAGNAVGRTGKTVGLGPDKKADGLAKALIDWATDYYPEPEE